MFELRQTGQNRVQGIYRTRDPKIVYFRIMIMSIFTHNTVRMELCTIHRRMSA